MLVEYAPILQKALTHVKLQHVISDITDRHDHRASGMEAGPRRPGMKADEATNRCHWREEHIFLQALELYRFYQGKIAECDRLKPSCCGLRTLATGTRPTPAKDAPRGPEPAG